jgi:hypothetical protein
MSCGNTARYPKQFPLWYGYIRKNYYFGQTGASINAGYYLDAATLDSPSRYTIATVTTETSGSDFLPQADATTPLTPSYYYAVAYVYDGYQISPLQEIQAIFLNKATSNGAEWHQVTLTIPWQEGSGFASAARQHHRLLSKRITAVELYCANDFDGTKGTGTFYRLVTIPIRQDFDFGFGGSRTIQQNETNQKTFSGGQLAAATFDYGRLKEDKTRQELYINWTGSDTYSYVFNVTGTVWTNRGFPYSFAAGGVAGNMINYAVGDENNNHAIVGKLFTGEAENSLIAYSPLKADSTPSPDYFPPIMVSDMARNGITSITDIKIIRDKMYIIGSTKSLRMAVNSGFTPTFRVDAEYDYIGSEAVNGTLKFRDGVITVCKKGVYYLDNAEHYLSAAIEDIDSFPLGTTTLSEAYIGLNGQTDDVYIVFPTDSKLFSYNLVTKQWVVHSLGTAILALVTGADGEIYGASSGKIFRLDSGTTDDSTTTISPTWKSKVYTMDAPDMEKVLNWVEITYRSDSAIQFDVFLNRGASVASWAVATDNQLAAATTVTTARLLFPATFRGYEFEFKFSLPSGVTDNTYFEVHELNVKGTTEERIT